METLQPKLRFPEFDGNWESIKIKDVISSIDSGWSPQCEDFPSSLNEWGVLKTTSVVWGGFNENENKKLPIKLKPKVNIEVFANDILITRAGPTNRVGVTVHVDKVRSKLMLSDKLIRLRTSKPFSSKFISILLSLENIKNQINSKSSGLATSQTNISQTILLNVKLDLPLLQEQTKIANFLSSVDEKLNLLKEKKETLEAYKKGIMQKIFNQEIRFKDDNGNDFEDWEEISTSELTSIIVGGTPSTTKDDYWNGEIPWLSSGELNNGIVSQSRKHITAFGLRNSSAKIMKANTVLLAMTGATLGKVGYLTFESCGNQSIAGFEPNDSYNSKFLFYTLLCSQNLIFSMAGGAAQQGINKASIESLLFNFPNIKEQTKIANFLSAIDQKIELVNTQIEDTQEYKKGLLQQMFV